MQEDDMQGYELGDPVATAQLIRDASRLVLRHNLYWRLEWGFCLNAIANAESRSDGWDILFKQVRKATSLHLQREASFGEIALFLGLGMIRLFRPKLSASDGRWWFDVESFYLGCLLSGGSPEKLEEIATYIVSADTSILKALLMSGVHYALTKAPTGAPDEDAAIMAFVEITMGQAIREKRWPNERRTDEN